MEVFFSNRSEAVAIWSAGVEAVRPERLISSAVRLEMVRGAGGDSAQAILFFGKPYGESNHGEKTAESFAETLESDDRVIVVGFGKASGSMAKTLEVVLRPLVDAGRVVGWVNVPENGVLPTSTSGKRMVTAPRHGIYLHGARPAGLNEPTEAGVFGSRRIVELVESARPNDLIIALISGGGSALLPLPVEGITLAEKTAVTRFLSASGANIVELNAVRGVLSQLKAGGLWRLARGKRLVSLLISDVLGDPLEVIAGGPTVPPSEFLMSKIDKTSEIEKLVRLRFTKAREILEKFGARNEKSLQNVLRFIERNEIKPLRRSKGDGEAESWPSFSIQAGPRHDHSLILANNRTAVSAAEKRAKNQLETGDTEKAGETGESGEIVELGGIGESGESTGESSFDVVIAESFSPRCSEGIAASEGTAEEVGRALLARFRETAASHPGKRVAILSGGEPVVRLVSPERRGKGGRNSQLVLAALVEVLRRGRPSDAGLVFLSGGTDGEDGPTDAAGAFFDDAVLRRARELEETEGLSPEDYLARNDARTYFERCGGLLLTGPTGTNVCDLRVILSS